MDQGVDSRVEAAKETGSGGMTVLEGLEVAREATISRTTHPKRVVNKNPSSPVRFNLIQ